jgi:hypothetical protein
LLVALLGCTPLILPRNELNSSLALLTAAAVSRDKEVLVVVPVVALRGLIDSLANAAATGAEDSGILLSTLA